MGIVLHLAKTLDETAEEQNITRIGKVTLDAVISARSTSMETVEARETTMKVRKPAACRLLERSQPRMAESRRESRMRKTMRPASLDQSTSNFAIGSIMVVYNLSFFFISAAPEMPLMAL